jgi:hypothetical protein
MDGDLLRIANNDFEIDELRDIRGRLAGGPEHEPI